MRASTELKKLYEEYKNNPEKCLLKTFKEGVTCKNQTILGTGAGADYQVFNKSCPAFAAEYAMTFIRLTRSHFGPLNRKTAQVKPACANLLGAVKNIIEADPEAACTEMF